MSAHAVGSHTALALSYDVLVMYSGFLALEVLMNDCLVDKGTLTSLSVCP